MPKRHSCTRRKGRARRTAKDGAPAVLQDIQLSPRLSLDPFMGIMIEEDEYSGQVFQFEGLRRVNETEADDREDPQQNTTSPDAVELILQLLYYLESDCAIIVQENEENLLREKIATFLSEGQDGNSNSPDTSYPTAATHNEFEAEGSASNTDYNYSLPEMTDDNISSAEEFHSSLDERCIQQEQDEYQQENDDPSYQLLETSEGAILKVPRCVKSTSTPNTIYLVKLPKSCLRRKEVPNTATESNLQRCTTPVISEVYSVLQENAANQADTEKIDTTQSHELLGNTETQMPRNRPLQTITTEEVNRRMGISSETKRSGLPTVTSFTPPPGFRNPGPSSSNIPKKTTKRTIEHKCSVCSKILANSCNLKIHAYIHLNLRNCACPTCRKSFKTLEVLRKHHRSAHGNNGRT